ncbi:MAG: endonuclease domain-containing protein [Bacteroidetes bacterium]|nr:endonuclease domain-containing protein [Bacteroidota bacterium]
MLPYRKDLKTIARTLRKNATFPERLLWSRLRRKQLGIRFLRQRPVGDYVVDFLCPDAALVIEVDGRSHEGQFERDVIRQQFIESQDLHILRFTNDEVLKEIDAVETRIADWLEGNSSL